MVNTAPESDDGDLRVQQQIVSSAEFQCMYVQHSGKLVTVIYERN